MIEHREITDRAEWLSWRKQDVTGSDVGALCGVDPRPERTPAWVYWEKRGMTKPKSDNAVMRRGRWLEDAFPRAVRDLRPEWKLMKPNVYWRDPELRLGGSPDYLIEGDERGPGVFEAKTIEADMYEKYYTAETVAPWVALQLMTYIILGERSWGAVGTLVLGYRRCDLEIYEMDRHAGAEEKIRETVTTFWRDVEDGREPPLDYTRDAALLSLIFPREEPGKIIDLHSDNELPRILGKRDIFIRLEKRFKERREALDAEIKHKVGDAERALVDGWQLTHKSQTRAAHAVRESTFRVLRIKREIP
jgi:predicted phage-related endonuclease